MLTCFSLKNVLDGLTILLEDTFGYKYDLRTIVLDSITGEIIEEINGSEKTKFALDVVTKPEYADCPILFEVKIHGRGTIIMDMFSRSSKFNQHQVSTLTEMGCSRLEGQQAVAYIVDGM